MPLLKATLLGSVLLGLQRKLGLKPGQSYSLYKPERPGGQKIVLEILTAFVKKTVNSIIKHEIGS